MVYILAASSVHQAIDALNYEQQSKLKDKIFAIPGIRPNLYAKNPRNNVQTLPLKDLNDRAEIVVWHDVFNTSICSR